MANLTNADLSVLCTSTGSKQYLKGQALTSSPQANPSIGKAGDWYYGGVAVASVTSNDPSLYMKVANASGVESWVVIDVSQNSQW